MATALKTPQSTGAVTNTKMLVTPEQAQYWLENNNYPNQRPLNDAHVLYLLTCVEHNQFRRYTTISFCVFGNKHYIVNGQHTLHMIVRYNKPFPLTIEDIGVENEEEMAAIYATFDRNRTRSHADIQHAHRIAERLNLPRGAIHSLGAALPVILSGFNDWYIDTRTPRGAYLKNAEIRCRYMLEWGAIAQKYYHFPPMHNKFIKDAFQRAAVAAIGLVTYKYASEMAHNFWTLARLDDKLAVGHPAKALLRFLQNSPAKKYNTSLYARYVASCWNAYTEGRTLSKIYARDLELPIFIAYTPFNGKDVIDFLSDELKRNPEKV